MVLFYKYTDTEKFPNFKESVKAKVISLESVAYPKIIEEGNQSKFKWVGDGILQLKIEVNGVIKSTYMEYGKICISSSKYDFVPANKNQILACLDSIDKTTYVVFDERGYIIAAELEADIQESEICDIKGDIKYMPNLGNLEDGLSHMQRFETVDEMLEYVARESGTPVSNLIISANTFVDMHTPLWGIMRYIGTPGPDGHIIGMCSIK